MRPLYLAALLACGSPDQGDSGVATPDCTWVFFADVDGDAHGDLDASVTACTAPAGHVARGDDCDDTDAAIHPGAAEMCNAVDDDCDETIDEDVIDALLWYADGDGDGFGDRGSFTMACAQPSGSSENGDDCDDDDAAVSPTAEETCNGIDDDCDALVDAIDPGLVDGSTWYDDDDGDGYGDEATAIQACTQPTDTIAVGGDCNDAVATISPDGAEICDGIDNDCDGLADDDDVVVGEGSTYYADADGDGYGDADVSVTACALPDGYVYARGDCDDTTAEVGPALAYYEDSDGDGYAIVWSSGYIATTCTPDPSWASEGGECNDGDADISPGAVEICNGIDDNCDDEVDEDDPLLVKDVWYDDDDGDGYGDDSNTTLSCDPVAGSVSVGGDCNDGSPAVYPAAVEFCDGLDNDCTGTIDDDVVYLDWYADDDGDGYGDDGDTVFDCVPPSDYVVVSGDCDDGSATVSPGAAEDCTTASDEDCDGLTTDCTFPLADAGFSLLGNSSSSSLGTSLDVADLDGDGVADLLVGSSDYASGYGTAYVSLGPSSGELTAADAIVINPDFNNQGHLGDGVHGGDADDDGVDDAIVGQGGDGSTGSFEAYVFYGPITADRLANRADAELVPFDANTKVEAFVVSDFDGDGEPDVVVGSPFGRSSREGRAYVVDGSATGTVDLDANSTYVYLSTDGPDRDALGYAIADLGDTSGDGIEDIALSAMQFGDGGVVYVLEGGAVPGTYDVDAAAAATLVGTDAASYGWSIASTDVDEDGTADLVVGAPDATIDSVVSGTVTLHLGPFAGEIAAGDATATFLSSVDDAAIGWSVDAGGDFDGDGRADIAIGAKVRTERGAAYLQLGPASGVIDVETLATFPGVGVDDWAGYTVAFVPDWTGDGRSELAIGSLNFGEADPGRKDRRGFLGRALLMRRAIFFFWAVASGCGERDSSPVPAGSVDDDGDGVELGADCDDDEALVHPGADERCNGIDDDCDGPVDEDAVDAIAVFTDADSDGFGDAEAGTACVPQADQAAVDGDCDDQDPARHPDALEICNGGVDDDCNGQADDADDAALDDRVLPGPRRRRVRRGNTRRIVRARCRSTHRRDRLRRRQRERPSRRPGALQRPGRRLRCRHHRGRRGERGGRGLPGDPASRGRRLHWCRRRHLCRHLVRERCHREGRRPRRPHAGALDHRRERARAP